MSAVLERPKPQVFEPVNYYDTKILGAEVKRWIFFPGDLIVPERKSEIDWLQAGGEETPSPCLQRYGRGFVPRGLPALLETGGEPIPTRHLGDLQTSAWAVPLNEEIARNKMGLVPVFPGHGLRVLLRYASLAGGTGMGELAVLRGKEWDECHTPDQIGILDIIERVQFSDGIEPTLRGLEAQIAHAQVTDKRIDYGQYKAEALKLCETFRNWASRRISEAHGLLKTGHVGEWQGGWSYSYSPITEMLLEQLEIPRQDQPLNEMAKMFERASMAPQSQGLSAVDMDMFERKMDERLAMARKADIDRIAELEARLTQQSVAQSEPEVKMFTCEHCGTEMKASARSFHIGKYCPVLHPRTSTE